MNRTKIRSLESLLVAVLAAWSSPAPATEYFVNPRGNDSQAGTDRQAALATVQKGVNLLQPGDILTIAPGEYHEAISRKDLGGADQETIIRAEIPGTVLLRGDVPAPVYHALPNRRFVYEADFDFAGEVPVVNEVDTLTILNRMPNSAELEFLPGTFFHDTGAKKLYLSTSDFQPVEAHHYTVSVRPTHGIYLVHPQRVTIEGIAATGYSAMGLLSYRAGTGGGVWGIFLQSGSRCVIRDCKAYLNAWGIGLNSNDPGSGDNVFERCAAWGNKSAFANGDMGGLTLFGARRDAIRHSTAFLNGMYGVNIYGTGGAPPGADDGGNDPKHRSLLSDNFAWGNETADIKIKTGYEYYHVAENCVGLGLWSTTNLTHGLVGINNHKEKSPNDIELKIEPAFDLGSEFADPDHHDYRLQATSRFRGTGVDGQDRGPFPYAPNIFYVKPDGDDQHDGLSVASAWKTLARAAGERSAGDTIYLEAGVYPGGLLKAGGKPGTPISLRGRGKGRVEIKGPVRMEGSEFVNFERICFLDSVSVARSSGIAFSQCELRGHGAALDAVNVTGLAVSHCLFSGFQEAGLSLGDCSQVDLSGNSFSHEQGVALRLAKPGMVRYSNYNRYGRVHATWAVKGINLPWAEVQLTQEQQSATSVRAGESAAGGPFGKPFGPYQDEPRHSVLRVVVPPANHSVSATTANLEWMVSLPATCQLAWGETAACEQTAAFNVNRFGTFSLTGLKPAQKYYFRIKSLETPKDMLPKTETQSVQLTDEPITFTTLSRKDAPLTYFVASDGDDTRSGLARKEAWRTIGHAAERVNAGDTVLIAGGKYFERIRLRATGEEGSPISFRAMPGERVAIEGADMALNSGFVAMGKSHLRFDGFYFANFNLFPNDSWSLSNSGEFQLYAGKDIEITRCFSDGRGGYSAPPIAAYEIENLRVTNCVNTNKFGGMYFWRCPDLVIEHTVFAAPMIMSFVLRNGKEQKSTMANCIFTDMFEKKAKLNIGLLCCDGPIDSFRHRNNDYLLRCFPTEERALNGSQTIGQLGDYILEPVFADPLFAGDPGVKGRPEDKSGYAPDRLMDPALKLDFDSFFTTNPELIKRGIGLQPEAFKDFRFEKK
jgi:hypothetical protein